MAVLPSFTTETQNVSIPPSEYQALVETKLQYLALRQALLSGGVEAEALDVLIKTNICSISPSADLPLNPIDQDAQGSSSTSPSETSSVACSATPVIKRRRPDAISTQTPSKFDTNVTGYATYGSPSSEEDSVDRAVVLTSCSPHTTLADITDAIRGGALLRVFMRPGARTAFLTFIQGAAAENLVRYSRQNPIYIKGQQVSAFDISRKFSNEKKVTVKWDERQQHLSAYLVRQIYQNKASRNLVIRFANPDMTPADVQSDLEHIHGLDIVRITRQGSHLFVSTNSVQHALTARYCMMSRFKYKGTKIEFCQDECNSPWPLPKLASAAELKQGYGGADGAESLFYNKFQPLSIH
ncbi:hypothetical protein PV10_07028 [Exophiala mesophila]|uniref:RRM domain-containing protein n=1 Tax=Exophiala mesophila TaxID=212818 RepID=A0A0D1Z4E2_EXOME|nr:uncharacterized protein PV10_07028 [Exophiala mesophila]KIV89642.1 hypothetical protein PV10_07028 [Exophiala mesophila]